LEVGLRTECLNIIKTNYGCKGLITTTFILSFFGRKQQIQEVYGSKRKKGDWRREKEAKTEMKEYDKIKTKGRKIERLKEE
jgi:hypothetical protein